MQSAVSPEQVLLQQLQQPQQQKGPAPAAALVPLTLLPLLSQQVLLLLLLLPVPVPDQAVRLGALAPCCYSEAVPALAAAAAAAVIGQSLPCQLLLLLMLLVVAVLLLQVCCQGSCCWYASPPGLCAGSCRCSCHHCGHPTPVQHPPAVPEPHPSGTAAYQETGHLPAAAAAVVPEVAVEA
jgi:hypothetical protein